MTCSKPSNKRVGHSGRGWWRDDWLFIFVWEGGRLRTRSAGRKGWFARLNWGCGISRGFLAFLFAIWLIIVGTDLNRSIRCMGGICLRGVLRLPG